MKLKVCGLTQITQIHQLEEINVDFLGFIFYEHSPRYVLNHLTLQEIAKVNHPAKVGVFVNESVKRVTQVANTAKLNFVQLHGDETIAYIRELSEELGTRTQIMKAFRISGNETFLQAHLRELAPLVEYFLFDTDSKHFGGTGKRFNWQVLNEVTIPKPYFLSGGISPENLSELQMLNLSPFALDINSKFETKPGFKDLDKIKKFYENL
ncbi:phosphoribosylanthranilate isomerase [Chryseobacterium sp. A321]